MEGRRAFNALILGAILLITVSSLLVLFYLHSYKTLGLQLKSKLSSDKPINFRPKVQDLTKLQDEKVTITFLSRRRRRDVSRQKMTILQLYRPETNQTVVLQIRKTFDLLVPDFTLKVNENTYHVSGKATNTDADNLNRKTRRAAGATATNTPSSLKDTGSNKRSKRNAVLPNSKSGSLKVHLQNSVYTGHSISISNTYHNILPNIRTVELEREQEAALTAYSCPRSLDNDSDLEFGFCGFIGVVIIDGVYFIIEPSLETIAADGAGTGTGTRTSFQGHGQKSPEYEHTIKRATSQSQGRKCSSTSTNNGLLKYDEVGENLEQVNIQSLSHMSELELRNLDLISQSELGGGQEADFKMESKTKVNNRPKPKPKPKPVQLPKSNSKVLELAIFADSKLYQKMKKKMPKNSLKNFTAYLLAQVNNMNLLYKDPSLGSENHIEIRLNYLEILTKDVKRLNTGKGRESIYLDSFCKFAASKNSDRAGWDHAMMLTGYDLRDGGSSGVIGVAWTAAMCDKRYSCSLVEASDFLGSYTMAHELGHSLGMNHDGEENNKACDSTMNLMAAIEGPGQVKWSKCSQKNIREYLAGKSTIPGASRPNCLKTSLKKNKRRKPISYNRNMKRPGELFTAAQQCILFLGKKEFKPVQDISFNFLGDQSMCQQLKCQNGTQTYSIHPALEGTLCGKGKWCKIGQCVSKQ